MTSRTPDDGVDWLRRTSRRHHVWRQRARDRGAAV